MNDCTEYSAREFVDLINDKFEEHVGEHTRIDVEWGMWSREMNLVIREKLETGGRESTIYGMVFQYWVIVSQLLDLIYYAKGLRRFLLKKKIKEKMQEAVDVREAIYGNS